MHRTESRSNHIGGRPSPSLRRRALNVRLQLRLPTARRRRLPDFLVIGAQRAGTSSLYKYLGQHPLVIPSLRKETEYLSRRYGNGLGWYRAHFPLRLTSGRTQCFEATPDYLHWPTAPARAARTVPGARFIVLLRDPVERAISHYRHMVRLGYETWTFEDAIRHEEERIADDREALERDEFHYARPFLRFSYCARGRYAEQLTEWFAAFPRDRFLILFSEDLFRSTAGVYAQVLRFLELPDVTLSAFPNYSYRGRLPVSDGVEVATRSVLAERFEEPNARLTELLGLELPWR